MDYFLRIQKTGGTSLREVLRSKPDVKFFNHGYMYKLDDESLWTRQGFGSLFIKDHIPEGSNIYTVVRNPFDIFVSYYLHENRKGWGNCNLVHNIRSWDEFVDKYLDPEFKWHVQPMKESLFSFIYNKQGERIITDYFKFENFDKLHQYLKSKNASTLPFTNKTKGKKHFTSFYSPLQVDSLSKVWYKDLQFFEYDFNIS